MNFLQKTLVNRFNPLRVPHQVLSLLKQANVEVQGAYLEIGAGLGYTASEIFDRYHPSRVVVTDFDPAQVENARKRAEHHYGEVPPEFEFQREDVTQLSFDAATFAFVLATYVFQLVENHWWQFARTPRAIEEIQRVLKPKGVFFFMGPFHKNHVQELFLSTGFTALASTRRAGIYQRG